MQLIRRISRLPAASLDYSLMQFSITQHYGLLWYSSGHVLYHRWLLVVDDHNEISLSSCGEVSRWQWRAEQALRWYVIWKKGVGVCAWRCTELSVVRTFDDMNERTKVTPSVR